MSRAPFAPVHPRPPQSSSVSHPKSSACSQAGSAFVRHADASQASSIPSIDRLRNRCIQQGFIFQGLWQHKKHSIVCPQLIALTNGGELPVASVNLFGAHQARISPGGPPFLSSFWSSFILTHQHRLRSQTEGENSFNRQPWGAERKWGAEHSPDLCGRNIHLDKA